MKKKQIVLLLIVTINFCFAQNKRGTIIYKKEIIEFLSEKEGFEINKEKRPKYYKTVLFIDQNTKRTIKDIEFSLKFNNVESIFRADVFLELETNRFYKVALGPEGSKIYYTNQISEQNIEQIDAYGELFLISYPQNEWVLYNETKKIGEYTCYKATTIKKTKGRKGIIDTPVEVWYTPDINIPLGPLGYNGLPGLIVELSMLNYKYYVSKIDLNSKVEINIKKPTQGKVLSKEEFEEIGVKAMDNFKKSFN
ncbi:GLPGLI family protein [Lutibacter sp. HS1-25]|uniref:GLPGLI family protein n=1 Tax=Lutibacter sp. HS1-25 TaxID=2485000 RepID=UPI0010109DF5|nr:GLPGLI family protein [Lutibacter sp. HS1-25]RXP56165.1 GLPGLI family protein [Lutibacter sp. HS1-25]